MNIMISSELSSIDPVLFRQVMGRFATGVSVITFMADGQPAGMTVNAFMSVSLSPALVVISVRRASHFTACIERGDQYGVNILAQSQSDVSSHFGGKPSDSQCVSMDLHYAVPLIKGCVAHAVAKVVEIYPAGDHFLYLGEVEYLSHESKLGPLIFFGGKYENLHTSAADSCNVPRCEDQR